MVPSLVLELLIMVGSVVHVVVELLAGVVVGFVLVAGIVVGTVPGAGVVIVLVVGLVGFGVSVQKQVLVGW